MNRLAILLLVLGPSAAMAPASRAATYCLDAGTGIDVASGIEPNCWRTLGRAQAAFLQPGDNVFIRPGSYDAPSSAWYMTPGVSWIGAGPYLTTVTVDTGAATPFVRFRTGAAGSGHPTDLRAGVFGPDTIFSNMRLVNEGAATIGVDVRVSSADSSPTLGFLIVEGFDTGVAFHPSSDERETASTGAILTNSIIRGATREGLLLFADVFYANLVTEASTVTNTMIASEGAGVRIATLVNDLRDASRAVVEPRLTNVTIAAGTESAVVLQASYDDGSGVRVVRQLAGTFAPEIVNSILTGSDRYGLEETSPFTEPALLLRSSFGGNALGQVLDEGTTPIVAPVVGGNNGLVPIFVDRAAGDLHVLEGSPTIDRLAPADAPSDDVDGHLRPQGARSDIGADEFVACTAFARLTLTQGASCTANPSVLDATGSTIGAACVDGPLLEWFIGNTLAGVGTQLTVNPRVDTTYRLRVSCADPTLSACFDEAEVLVLSSQGPSTAEVGPDVSGCFPEGPVVIPLDATGSTGADLTFLWTTTAGTIVNLTSEQAELHVDLADAEQVITVSVRVAPEFSNCFSADTVVVTLRPIPVAVPGGPYQVVDSGGATDLLALVGSSSSGAGPLTFSWTTDLGAFLDTGTASSALADPTLVVDDAAGDQFGEVCLTVTTPGDCSDTACTRVSVVQTPSLPPNDVGPTLRVTKLEPTWVRLRWQDAPVDVTHDLADEYRVMTSSRACGPFTIEAVVPRVPGVNEYLDPILHDPPRLRFYVIVSINAAGASTPGAPDGSACR